MFSPHHLLQSLTVILIFERLIAWFFDGMFGLGPSLNKKKKYITFDISHCVTPILVPLSGTEREHENVGRL